MKKKHIPFQLLDNRAMGFDIQKIGLYRKTLMGLAAISIFVMHFTAIGVLKFEGTLAFFGKILGAWTAIGVEVFCLVSGYGIFHSLSNTSNLRVFFEKRLERVIIPFLVITIPGYTFLLNFPLKECLVKWSTLYFWLEKNDGSWFVSFIILMYVLAPFFHRMYDNNISKWQVIGKHSIFMVALWGGYYAITKCYPAVDERWGLALARIPMFFTGMLFASLEKHGRGKICWITILFLCAICLVKAGINKDCGVFETTLIQCRSIVFICLECQAIEFVVKYFQRGFPIVDAVGKCSLEFYLIHGLLMNWLRKDPGRLQYVQGNFLAFALLFVVTYTLSLAANYFSMLIIKALKGIRHRRSVTK